LVFHQKSAEGRGGEENKEHLTVKGLTKIVSIKASMNKGLSKKLVTEFPDITPVLRPQVTDQVIKDPN